MVARARRIAKDARLLEVAATNAGAIAQELADTGRKQRVNPWSRAWKQRKDGEATEAGEQMAVGAEVQEKKRIVVEVTPGWASYHNRGAARRKFASGGRALYKEARKVWGDTRAFVRSYVEERGGYAAGDGWSLPERRLLPKPKGQIPKRWATRILRAFNITWEDFLNGRVMPRKRPTMKRRLAAFKRSGAKKIAALVRGGKKKKRGGTSKRSGRGPRK